MNELMKSKTKYNLKKSKNEICFSANQLFIGKKMHIQDYIYDSKNSQWIFAIKCMSTPYHFDYVFLDNNFKILNVLTEDKGYMPNFITSPNQDVWVELTEPNSGKHIYLPLFDRNRIDKGKTFKNLGMQCHFNLSDNCYSYFIHFFDKNKFDNLFIYEFDDKNLLKNRKQIILDNIYSGYPFVADNRCFISYGEWNNSVCDLYINEIDKDGNFVSKWKGDPVPNIGRVILIANEETKIKFLSFCDKNIELLEYNEKGKLVLRKKIYECKKEILSSYEPKTIGNVVSVSFVCEGGINSILLLINDSVKVIEADTGYTLSLLNEDCLISKPIVDQKKFKIVKILK